ncbi:MAG: Arm DNA-binding domain-containing protein [Sneathiella sp.]
MAIHRLTPRKVSTAGPGKYEDGGGLRLVVSNTGARKWVLRFTISGKRREMGLGSYPDVGLADARTRASVYRQQSSEGIDPIEKLGVLSSRPYRPSLLVPLVLSVPTDMAGRMPNMRDNG